MSYLRARGTLEMEFSKKKNFVKKPYACPLRGHVLVGFDLVWWKAIQGGLMDIVDSLNGFICEHFR